MEVHFKGARVKLRDADQVGEGGEARVFAHQGLALKVFHPVPPGDAVRARVRAQKLLKLERFPQGLPPEVVAPVGLLHDRGGAVLGYAMPLVADAEESGKLLARAFREGQVDNRALLQVLAALQQVVTALHARGVVVGDLNDGNVLLQALARPLLIDVDSMQFGGLPCAVGHERYLDPALYGVDLSAAPRMTEQSDAYALAVLAFSALLYVHPYGGVFRGLPTLLRRAEARHSVLRSDVALPRSAAPREALTDEALHYFSGVFDGAQRSPLPPAVLEQRFSRCSCGLEHARAVCPACHTLGPISARPLVRSQGRCTARSILHTSGRVLCAAMQGGLRYAFEEGGVVRREDRSLVQAAPAGGARFAIAGACTWVLSADGSARCMKGGEVQERATTGLRGTTPVFAAASAVVYRTEGAWLVEHLRGARVGQVLEGQTWLWTGERLGLGLYRAGGFQSAFLLRTGQAGLLPLALPPLEGRLVEADCVFDDGHALLSVRTELGGREANQLWLLGQDGRVRGHAAGHDGLMFQSVRGRALLDGRVVTATDSGLLALKLERGHLLEGTLFADTQSFVSAGDGLLAQPDGSLITVGPRELLQLAL